MLFVWRGWGLLALVPTFLPLASCAGLMDWNPMWAMICFGVSLFAGGLACRHYGKKWNQGTGIHMMYFIPLEIWGWIYIIMGGTLGTLGAVILVKQAVVG